MGAALEKAIAGMYESFSCESKPAGIAWCTCSACAAAGKSVPALISKPLRSLTPEELSGYAESVFLTAGSEWDFRYFLPRIMEILIIEDGWWPGPEVVGKAIATGWKTFSEQQQQSILSLVNELITELIVVRNGHALDEWLCGISRFVASLKPYLDLIEKHPRALIAFYEQNSGSLGHGSLANSFWDGRSPNEKILLDWFQSKEIKDLIVAAYGLN